MPRLAPKSPFRPQAVTSAENAAKEVADAEAAATALPPDVLGSWHHFATALGLSVPGSLNRAAGYRRSFRQAIR